MGYSDVGKILGGPKVLHTKIKDQYDLTELGRIGVTKGALINLAKWLQLPMGDMADLLLISERTLQRYAPDKRFNPTVSERILKISVVLTKGIQVFEDKEKFLLWINQPNTAFSNKTPMSLLNSIFGADMIIDELGRIEHGVFS
jgi:putative toxin-antitoxin system antitoxin component (TIGR02293 family)